MKQNINAHVDPPHFLRHNKIIQSFFIQRFFRADQICFIDNKINVNLPVKAVFTVSIYHLSSISTGTP